MSGLVNGSSVEFMVPAPFACIEGIDMEGALNALSLHRDRPNDVITTLPFERHVDSTKRASARRFTSRRFAPYAHAILLILGLVTIEPGAALAQKFEPAFFGAHIHRSLRNNLWMEAGFGAFRLHDANVTWAELQPAKDRWDWDRLDRIVEKSRRAGVEILLPLQATPTWAASDPASKGAYGMGANTMPARMADWEAYVSAVVTRYKGAISGYEIWNEPNLKQFYTGSPEDLAALTRTAAKIVRAVDPEAKLVCASITGDYGIPWLKRYLQNGTGASCDVIGYHFYTHHEPPERMLKTISEVQKVMASNSLSAKPLWNTESGWLMDVGGKRDIAASGFGKDAKVLTLAEATAYVPRALLVARQAGIDRFYWYAWDHTSMGLTAERGTEWTRAARVYAEFLKIMVQARMQGCSPSSGAWTCNLVLGDGAKMSVLWSESGERAMSSPLDGTLMTVSEGGAIEGSRKVSVAESLAVGEMPVFIKGALP